jgi:hypothetical protein
MYILTCTVSNDVRVENNVRIKNGGKPVTAILLVAEIYSISQICM